ncbi:MAG: DUF3604 domain-containing protein [Candidatus Hydrogenedentes bacterium]|nr:DUF3604 domain-containing protein [Candidatus Hydrogenedentota bacterium]
MKATKNAHGIAVVALAFLLSPVAGHAQDIGQVPIPKATLDAQRDVQLGAAKGLGIQNPKQVVFGDTHVHTTYSVDAYFWALPMMQGQGEGVYPPSDACDYARYCSALDFYFLTDHAEAYTPEHWKYAKESIRQCNGVSGDPANPDMVAYMGFEWTQVGPMPNLHYGHKNVLFKGIQEDELPKRPIGAKGMVTDVLRGNLPKRIMGLTDVDPKHPKPYRDFESYYRSYQETPDCAEGVSSPDLPEDCFESTTTPGELFEKLDQWGLDTIVIPHGSTWGFYTPPGTTFDKHLKPADFDSDKQRIIEIYSGHGNSEQYRDWRAVRYDDNGKPYCPEPTDDYLPSCWQAGEIIRERCKASGYDDDECELRAVDARAKYVSQPTVAGHLTVPGADPEAWLDSGQARDIFEPAFNYRPAKSVQYSMAISNFDDPENPLRHRWGFIGSSDNHRARPGTGYKQVDRHRVTEGSGPRTRRWDEAWMGKKRYAAPRSMPLLVAAQGRIGFQLTEAERQASFFVTGGLAAVHTEGRSRDQIWDAMKRKEVYATSGERILLWFDLLNGPEGEVPMGGEAAMTRAPKFRARAVGSFKQLPGCPEHSVNALSADRLMDLCRAECYNPSDERKVITRIEVVRIRPQENPNEYVGDLIEDPWRVFECGKDEAGCVVEFSDPDFDTEKRDTLYYVRAIEEPTLVINGQNLRPTYDDNGNVIAVDPCYGNHRTQEDDDCLGEVEPRAWSSPIFVDWSG